ncbi:MAG: neuraminidase, partial [Treponema sp.]|nr:neuraminidase [Treponema sp.]
TIDTTVKEIVKISGYASDKNGIAKVQVSLDNGNSYNDAVGTENWSYTVDTRAIPGGTQVVFLKITDKYGIQGLYSSLINIDNDAPELSIELPLDDSLTTGQLFISGSNYDKVGVTDLFVTIRNLEKTSRADKRNIRIDRIIGETIDLTNLENGFYNVEITAKDKAGNITNCSRNIHLNKNKAPVTVGILYPLNGEHKQGVFNIYGQSEAESEIESLKLFIDDKLVSETTITDTGYFKFEVGPDLISEGTHTYHVDSVLKNGIKVSSREQTITYSPVGPWVTIDNFTYGDFATGRPYIRGQAGYSISEDELLYSKTKEATKEEKAAVAAKKVAKIELSFDNGKTFQVLSTSEKWMYRIENQDIPEGFHFFLVRATMENGETAITRCIIQIDNTSPNVRLISPAMGGRYNQNLDFSGLSNDDVQLEKVTLALRKGDKASYAVPAFIQGLYLDFHFWGASLFDIGAGLTFFDDNVRLQVQWGQFTQDQRDAISGMFGVPLSDMRYGGNVFGLKLLANIFTLPFSFFFGRDWEWLSASFALGANFSLFTETNSGKPQFLSAMLGQIEFPRVHLANMKAFSTFSFYTEGSLWFIPTDVSSQVEIQSIVPQIAVGIRVNIF